MWQSKRSYNDSGFMSTSPRNPSGIDPVNDLLGKLEQQVSRAEANRSAGQEQKIQDTLSAFQSRLASELHEIRTLREDLRAAESRGNDQLLKFTQAMSELRTQLPGLIEETISSRLIEIEERFHHDIQEIHNRGIEGFVQSAQARVGQRMANLESNMASQIDAMAQLQDYHLRTDRNVQRLLGGLDRLSAELMRLSNLAGAPIVAPRRADRPSPNEIYQQQRPQEMPVPVRRAEPQREEEPARTPRSRKFKIGRPSRLFIPVLVLLVLIPLAIIGWSLMAGSGGLRNLRLRQARTPDTAAVSGTDLQMKNAASFAASKDYAAAENIYRTIIKNEPDNREAIKELASVLFKQQRYEDAAAVLKTLPPGQ
jgi:tetratricopeptide (TPR) repeat protein